MPIIVFLDDDKFYKMITASAVGLLRMILYILAFYFIVKILARLFMPFFIKSMAKKVEKRFGQQFENYQNQTQQPKGKEGETVIDKIPTQKKSSNNDIGDYVDFEEID